MTATLISESLTPCTPVRCTFCFSVAPVTSVIGGAPGLVVGTADLPLDPALPHATVRSATTAPAARIRVRIGFPPSSFEPALPPVPVGIPDANVRYCDGQ